MIPKEFDLTGRVAIVTGASMGIGAATAALLAQRGAEIAIAGRNVQPLEDRAASIGAASGKRCIAIAADVTKEADVDRLVQQTLGQLGRIDILINNVGGGFRPTPLTQLEPRFWEKGLALNATSAYLCARAVSTHFIARRAGAIVNVSSMAGVHGTKGFAAYSAAKAAVQMFTRVAAAEWGPHGIRVNCVAAGMIATEKAIAGMGEENMEKTAAAAFPLRRAGRPDDVAQAIVFLASDASSYISGETLIVAGGPPLKGLDDA